MKCPVCNLDLLMMERQGVEIDYCQQCRGVWLDRGELDKIIERSTSEMSQRPTRENVYDQHDKHHENGEHYKGNHKYHHGNAHEKGHNQKGRSFLMDLFD